MSERYTIEPDGKIDEIVMHGANVHLERLDRQHWMLMIYKGNGSRKCIHLTVRNVVEMEHTGVERTTLP